MAIYEFLEARQVILSNFWSPHIEVVLYSEDIWMLDGKIRHQKMSHE